MVYVSRTLTPTDDRSVCERVLRRNYIGRDICLLYKILPVFFLDSYFHVERVFRNPKKKNTWFS